jgi:hypothetical protein
MDSHYQKLASRLNATEYVQNMLEFDQWTDDFDPIVYLNSDDFDTPEARQEHYDAFLKQHRDRGLRRTGSIGMIIPRNVILAQIERELRKQESNAATLIQKRGRGMWARTRFYSPHTEIGVCRLLSEYATMIRA